MPEIAVEVKYLAPDARLPVKATEGSAYYDIHSIERVELEPGRVTPVHTGLAFSIPEELFLEIRPRSGLSKNKILIANSPGTLDSDYRGELIVMLFNAGTREYRIKPGDRIAQINLQEARIIDFQEVKELSKTERGSGGFGSTGR